MTEGFDGGTPGVRLLPGFPLPAGDYRELLARLEADGGPGGAIVVAHSRGALDALASDAPPGAMLFLLAPSIPRRRPGTGLLKAVLLVVGSIPMVRETIAHRLRDATYRRYGADPPGGAPLDLMTAASRLRSAASSSPAAGPRRIVVVVADADPRRVDQLLLAGRLGAPVLHHAGSHLFPITHAASTAALLRAAMTTG